MKFLLIVLFSTIALLALAGVIFYIAGAQMPREHRSIVSVTLQANRTAVWSAITDYAVMPQWWPAVKAVRMEKLADGTELTWNTDAHNKQVPFRTGESRPNEKLVRVIATDQLSFGGTWTYELVDAGANNTRLTLTEDGIINPPIFRAIAKWFYGLDTTQRDYLAHLEKHLATSAPK